MILDSNTKRNQSNLILSIKAGSFHFISNGFEGGEKGQKIAEIWLEEALSF
jgi:hypothetical protein